jgi:hypothetical protein
MQKPSANRAPLKTICVELPLKPFPRISPLARFGDPSVTNPAGAVLMEKVCSTSSMREQYTLRPPHRVPTAIISIGGFGHCPNLWTKN